MSSPTLALQLSNVSLSFAGVRALRSLDLAVEANTLHAIIGPNGAGKTSLFNCISGSYRPQEGHIEVFGETIMSRRPDEITARGVARMFQNLLLFEYMTVLDNLMLGRHQQYAHGFLSDLFRTKTMRDAEVSHRKTVEGIIEFLALESYRHYPIAVLPYGVLKKVELGRALAMEPKLLLLDEPAAGLNQEETEDMARFILDIKEVMGITQILIEHELRFVFDLADRITVLDFGQKIAEGRPASVRADPAVTAAYMGLAGEAVDA
ncbi:MAG: ABC transporter ATP-binding protein [Myxococcota bacterium]|nr:ABC transporter ATP-binding protein [Myxococcota bacterium]